MGVTDEAHIRDALRAQNKILAILIERTFPPDGAVDPQATEATEAWVHAADEIDAIRVRGDAAREANTINRVTRFSRTKDGDE